MELWKWWIKSSLYCFCRFAKEEGNFLQTTLVILGFSAPLQKNCVERVLILLSSILKEKQTTTSRFVLSQNHKVLKKQKL